MDCLRIASFNMHGANNGAPMLTDLLRTMDVVVVQEHWLRECNFLILNDINRNFDMFAVLAMNQDSIIMGRPYGGIAILWRKSCLPNVNVFTMHDSSRCMDISFMTSTGLYFIFNVYLPCLSMYDDEHEIELVE